KEDRYEAKLEANLSMLPSYTQLGMAALLPNTSLAIADNDSGTVLVDEQSSQGTQNRTKILRAALNDKAIAIKANAFMEMHRDESRELLKANDVIYLYHNRIDHTGDKIQSEGEAFDAAERTLDDLMRLVKRLTAANASNILLTADHGFIYQHKEIDESDFAGQEVTGEQVLYRDRRFVLGKGLSPNNSVKLFRSKELGLSGDMEVAIPKSINRLRLRGSGSRFVHGGAALQEVVVPVVRINKKRQSDLSQVEVEILRGSSSVITSGQLAVRFYQDQAVTEKLQARVLRAGIYTESGDLISDCHELNFDFISENTRERELQVRFVLARNADDVNQQEVILRLDEKLAGTTHFKEYKSLRYMMRRSFTSDFDF
ncbi:MAG: BREX-1 system phosphatase PglZ type A, partial [Methylomarinum sp.]|nr:BREX-1 system phosphatase PglZ type A [Methylomarinum sp.]